MITAAPIKTIDDSTFNMIETIIPANAEEKHLPNKEVITKWSITSSGKIGRISK